MNDKMYEEMKAEGVLLAQFVGTVQVHADQVEQAKQAMEQRFGFPAPTDWEYSMLWTTLDNAVCRMRELVEEYDTMRAARKEANEV